MSACRKLHVGAKAGFSCASSAVHFICLAVVKERRQLAKERKRERTYGAILKQNLLGELPLLRSRIKLLLKFSGLLCSSVDGFKSALHILFLYILKKLPRPVGRGRGHGLMLLLSESERLRGCVSSPQPPLSLSAIR